MRLHSSVCVSFTRQSESLGPVHPAAHCMWQQSLARGPLHRWQPDAHLVLVTLNKYEKVNIFSCTSLIYLVSLSYSAHDVNSQVSQSRAVSPQHLFSHTLEQFGPVPEETTKKVLTLLTTILTYWCLYIQYISVILHLGARGCSRCSLASMFCSSKVSLQLIFWGSGKHSWGFPQIYTPPKRISAGEIRKRSSSTYCYSR